MKIDNVHEGMVVKNYRELCKLLDIKYKTGEAKKNQMEELERFIQYKKNGHKIIIEKIHKKPSIVSETKKRRTNYTKHMEKLILDLLVQDGNNGEIYLSKTRLLQTLDMINDNYIYCKSKIPSLSSFIQIEEITIHEWYNNTTSMLERNITTALNSLRQQALVYWNKHLTVCEVITDDPDKVRINKTIRSDGHQQTVSYDIQGVNNKVYREATVEETQKILAIEKETLYELDCMNKQELYKKGKWNEFNTIVDAKVYEKLNFAFYYESYKIICNKKHIIERWFQIEALAMNSVERIDTKTQLNKEIKEKIVQNAVRRQSKTDKELSNGEFNDKIYRLSPQYIDDMSTLTRLLIDPSTINIKERINKIDKKEIDKKENNKD